MKELLNKVHLGDCLEVMDELIENNIIVDAIITDVPYGTTACKWDTIIPFSPMWERLNKLIKPNGAIVLFGSEPFSSALRMSNIKNYKYDWVWKKNRGTGHLNAKKVPLLLHENVLVFYKERSIYNPQKTEGKQYKRLNCSRQATNKGVYGVMDKTTDTINNGDRYPVTVIDFKKVERTLHPTQKPVDLMAYLVKTYTNENELVLDFTAGSGTTGVACKQCNRNFILIEKEKDYVLICNKRLAQETLF